MVNYCSVSGAILDASGNPVANASIDFNPVIPQVIQGQYIQPVILESLTDDNGLMEPISLPWGLMVQITVNDAAPFTVMVPSIGSVDFGSLAMNSWPVLSFDPRTFFLLEDFPPNNLISGLIGTNGWSVTSIGGTAIVTNLTAEAEHPGIIELTTPAVIDQGGTLALSPSPATQYLYGVDVEHNWQLNLVFRLADTASTRFAAGLLNDYGQIPTVTYLGIRFDSTAGDTTFQYVASDGGGGNQQTIDSLIPVDLAWHTFQISCASAGNLLYSLDRRNPQLITTHIPTAGLTPAFQLLTAANESKAVDIDFYSLAFPSLLR